MDRFFGRGPRSSLLGDLTGPSQGGYYKVRDWVCEFEDQVWRWQCLDIGSHGLV
jgi:hypothetical protein